MDTAEIEIQQMIRHAAHSRDAGVLVTPSDIERFLAEWEARGRVEGTLKWYRRGLYQMYEMLPADRRIRQGTLSTWRDDLVKAGYATNTINLYLSVANTYLEFLDRREYQLPGSLQQEEQHQPELSRVEYLRLLQTAKILGNEKAYLLVKLFAATEMPVQELEKVTVEAAKEGRTVVISGGIRQIVRLPGCLCRELLAYAGRCGIGSGPIFLTKKGGPMSRTYVTSVIARLCKEARVPMEKGNPRCLRRLYMRTRAEIEANITLLMEQALDRQMEMEQLTVGWDVQ